MNLRNTEAASRLTPVHKCGVSDAFVFFGATGDLAYKKIFPALYGMVQHGTLQCPVIGVAKSGWNLSQLCARARESIQRSIPGFSEKIFSKLVTRPAPVY